MEHSLIVNADDYGLTPGVSAGIRHAALQGIVTSTTAMMNMPDAAPELPKALAQCPSLGIGVHLTLTVGKPLLSPSKIPSLVDEQGNFFRREAFIKHLPLINAKEAHAEWTAQVEEFVRVTGLKPDHLDSHHHSSYYTPDLFENMLELAALYGCPIRYPYNDLSSSKEFLPGKDAEKDYATVQMLTEKYQPERPSHFSPDFYAETADREHLVSILEKLCQSESKCWEIMCHPAEVDEALRQISSYGDPRETELKVLTDPSIKVVLQKGQIRLISYLEVATRQ
jgi:predicted glycoside hydrolase/deacetylase ChbG (UPF0249 family)